MTKARLQRQKIEHRITNAVAEIFPLDRIEIHGGSYINCKDLAVPPFDLEIIRTLNRYVRTKNKTRGVVNSILSFLRFMKNASGVINTELLKRYIKLLDEDSEKVLSTKYQTYLSIKGFVTYLVEQGVIPELDIPFGFDAAKINRKHKASFAEIARNFVENSDNFDSDDISSISDALEIKRSEAQAFKFSWDCIDILHHESLSRIAEWESDWNFTQSIIESLTPEDICRLQSINGISDPCLVRDRTLEDAVALMFAKFGSEIPSVRYWPIGVEDFLRKHWNGVAVRLKLLLKGDSSVSEDIQLLNYVQAMSEAQLDEYRALESFRVTEPMFNFKSVELAISILYAHQGRLVLDSTRWPEGIADYLKGNGWVPSRVRASLFPTVKSVTPFIVGLLSYPHLSPNVDSVSQYSYLNSFRPLGESGKVNIYFDKFRGNGIQAVVDGSDEIVAACIRHCHRVSELLTEIGQEGQELLKKKKTPLFLQYTPSAMLKSDKRIRPPEASTVTNIVRDFIKSSSEQHPMLRQILSASGENFRPTCALLLRLSGESLARIKTVLNHQHLKTTEIYVERTYTQSILKTKAKKFMQYLVDTADTLQPQSSDSEPESLFDSSGTAVDEWINCQAQRVWFSDIDIIAEWLAWESAISGAESYLSYANPARWEKYWLPRLLKYRNLIALVSGADLNAARLKTASIVLPPLS